MVVLVTDGHGWIHVHREVTDEVEILEVALVARDPVAMTAGRPIESKEGDNT